MGFCRDLRDNRPLTIKIGVSISIIITIIVLIAKSFDGIDAHQYGLLYNGVSVKIDNDNVYDTGLYYVGLGNSFIHVRTPRIIYVYTKISINDYVTTIIFALLKHYIYRYLFL